MVDPEQAQSCARQRTTLRFFLLQAASEFLESETLRYPLLLHPVNHAPAVRVGRARAANRHPWVSSHSFKRVDGHLNGKGSLAVAVHVFVELVIVGLEFEGPGLYTDGFREVLVSVVRLR